MRELKVSHRVTASPFIERKALRPTKGTFPAFKVIQIMHDKNEITTNISYVKATYILI